MTPHQTTAARSSRRAGLTLAEIAEVIGVAPSEVYKATRDIPVPMEEKRAQVIAAVRGGMSYRAAEARYGVAYSSVARWCKGCREVAA